MRDAGAVGPEPSALPAAGSRTTGGALVAPLAEGPEREAQTREEVARTLRYERGLLWKAGVGLVAVLLVVVVNLIATH